MSRHAKIIVAVMAVMLMLIVGCGTKEKNAKNETVVAEVNGDKITQAQVDKHYSVIKVSYEMQANSKLDDLTDEETIADLKEQAFDDLIKRQLVLQETAKQNLKINEKDITAVADNIKQSYNSDEPDGFTKFLQENSLTEALLYDEIKTDQYYQVLYDEVTKDIVVTDEEAEKYYNENIDSFKEDSGIQIYHILVKEEDLAKDIIARLQKGEDFALLASEYSIDESNKDNAGDLGLVNEQTSFVEEFKTAALNLNPQEMTTEPVKTTFGYHIIKAGDRHEGTLASLAEVQAIIKSNLVTNKKSYFFNQYMDDLRSQAEVKDLR